MADSGDPQPQVLGGRYQLGALLGYGGMAEVFRGRDVRLGREVAVKVLRSELARDSTFLARFRREAQSAAALSQPNIVAVYDTGEEPTPSGPLPFIVMEYVEGRTLRDVLQSEGVIQPRRALGITAEVCAALEYSHENGIVHRDIKPGNVMITRTGAVKVMDFGIARAMAASQSTVTQTSAVMGTAQYLSPEQARGEHVDARSDVYSTGILLYELLTGKPPFTGDSPVAVAYQHVREDPIAPSVLNPELAGDLDAVVLKAMAKNPANRYQSAAAFGADLERAAAGRRVTATPVLSRGNPTTLMAAPAADVVQTTVLARDVRDPHGSRRGVAYGLLAAAVVAIVVIGALLVRNVANNNSSSTVSAPQLMGLTNSDAINKLTSLNLKLGTDLPVFQTDSKIPKNQVITQSIAEGFPVKTGTVINLTYSGGIQTTQVPTIINEDIATAKSNLAAAKLKAGSPAPTEIDSLSPGTVVKAVPSPGTTVPINTTVSLTVVSNTSTVPQLVGLDASSAQRAITAAGFTIGNLTMQNSDTIAAGTVISSNPSQGANGVTRGSPVNLVVAQTPPPSPSPSPTPSSAAPATTGPAAPPTTGAPTDTTPAADPTAVGPTSASPPTP